jgi:diguanylate cyclase (GGDEF)-like protein
VSFDSLSSLGSNAEILVWQSRIRMAVATVASVAALMLLGEHAGMWSGGLPGPGIILLATFSYLVFASASAAIAQRRGRIPESLVLATVMSDVAFIFALSIAVSAPQYYDRILIFAFFALHLNTFYFGRRHAAFVLALTAVGYSALIDASMRYTAVLSWREELMTLTVFLLAGGLLLVEHGSLRARLATIVRLFARAEEGDFSEAYDEAADARPDAITRVGRAYNRVRGQLASMVLTDPLTGCVNRRGFDQALAREIARCDRAGSDIALLALDVDHFKHVNDSLGHPVGDAVLREMAALLLRAARAGDVVARTGGEEFSFLLPDTGGDGAAQLATRVCDAIRAHQFGVPSNRIRLTVSIGVASAAVPVAGRTLDAAEVLKGRADQALYSAKRAGRDGVRVWVSERGGAAVAGALTSQHAPREDLGSASDVAPSRSQARA